MTKISLSGQEKSIEFILSWYEDQVEAINDFKKKVISSILHPSSSSIVNKKFTAFTINEINSYFDDSKSELKHLVCFNLISATEAFLRADYNRRVEKKEKTKIGRLFKEIDKNMGVKVFLEEDIIEAWKSVKKKTPFSDFLGLLKYRHWLAHGRYWTPKFGRNYSFDIAYEIVENVFKVVLK